MTCNQALGLAMGASLLLGYGAIAQAAPMAASQDAAISNADVLILAAQKERGERQSGRQENRSGRQGEREERRDSR